MDIENNIRKAFSGVKKDILEIKDQLLQIAERQERLEAVVEESKKKVKNSGHEENSAFDTGLVQIKETPKRKVKKTVKKAKITKKTIKSPSKKK